MLIALYTHLENEWTRVLSHLFPHWKICLPLWNEGMGGGKGESKKTKGKGGKEKKSRISVM